MEKPKIVCICGSTRFIDLHAIKKWELEKNGKCICLMINYLPGWYAETLGVKGTSHYGEQLGLKETLDELHLRKIDLCDLVWIINHGGYIGESTQMEIDYAEKIGKEIRYSETGHEDEADDNLIIHDPCGQRIENCTCEDADVKWKPEGNDEDTEKN